MSVRGHFSVSCTLDEHRVIKDAAEAAGIKPGTFVKQAALERAHAVLAASHPEPPQDPPDYDAP